MGKFLKIILSLIAFLVLAIMVLVVALPFFIDANDYKTEIETAFKDGTGRDLRIDGDLHLSVFPWLGITTGKLALKNSPEFPDANFAEIAEADIKVKLMSLLTDKIEVERIALKGLSLNLMTKANGDNNWDKLSNGDSKPQTETKMPTQSAAQKTAKTPKPATDTKEPKDQATEPLPDLLINGIMLEDALIIWDDRKNDQYIELQKINFTTEALKFDAPVNLDLSLTLKNAKPEITEQLQLSTALIINQALDQFSLNNFQLNSITEGATESKTKIISTANANISVDLTQQRVKIPDLKITINELNLSANLTAKNIIDKPQFSGSIKIAQFDLRTWLQQLGVQPPAMQDPSTLSTLALAFNLIGTDTTAKLEQLQIQLDDSQLNGQIEMTDFSSQAIVFKLALDSINVDRYRANAENKEKSGDKESQAVAPLSAAATATLLPIKTLQDLNISGQLSIGQLTINRLRMQGVSLDLKSSQGLIQTEQQVQQFYQGQYSGKTKINIQTNKPHLAINEKLRNVQIAPLLKDLNGNDRLSGTFTASANLTGHGNTLKAIKSSLNGVMRANVNQGYVKGFNLQSILDNAQSLRGIATLLSTSANDKTTFSALSASAKIRNGVIINHDLYAKASSLRVNGNGKINLVSDSLDYKIEAKLVRGEASTTKSEKITGLPIIIKVSGTMPKPNYTLDIASMLLDKNKAKIEEKKQQVLDKIDKKYGVQVDKLFKQFF